MPILEYYCELCNTKTEKLMKKAVQDIKCPVCKAANAHLVPSPTGYRRDHTCLDDP